MQYKCNQIQLFKNIGEQITRITRLIKLWIARQSRSTNSWLIIFWIARESTLEKIFH